MEQVLGLECKELAFYTFKTIETDANKSLSAEQDILAKMVSKYMALTPLFKRHGTS